MANSVSKRCGKPHSDIWGIGIYLATGQAKPARHICAGCAFEQGRQHAAKRQLPNFDPSILQKCQGEPFRHKDACYAYCEGYRLGRQDLLLKNLIEAQSRKNRNKSQP